MKNNKRAARREHKERMKKRAHQVFPGYAAAGTLADHLQSCSCDLCCNVRRNPWTSGSERLLLSERKFHASANNQEMELYE